LKKFAQRKVTKPSIGGESSESHHDMVVEDANLSDGPIILKQDMDNNEKQGLNNFILSF